MKERANFELFRVSDGVAGTPVRLAPASFAAIGALELQDIERWIRDEPTLVGEDLKIVTNQFAHFEGAKDRLDVLALDRAGRLVVIEAKRDSSGSYQDLQAIRYAAFASTFQSSQVVEAHRHYLLKAEQRSVDTDEARAELEGFIEGGDLDVIDDDQQPRIVLVAGGFQVAVTSTVLWLRRSFLMDITCVQLVPYEINGELVLGSSILIPLPEAGDYEVKVAEKERASKKGSGAPINHDKARAFIEAIPRGRWSAYVDVAQAADSPKGAQAVGWWLANRTGLIPNMYRVLTAWGEVSSGWKAASPELPADPAGVRRLLEDEGVIFSENGRADPSLRWTLEDHLEANRGDDEPDEAVRADVV
jgi:alkylated DNA nucleotide flippase Atl1